MAYNDTYRAAYDLQEDNMVYASDRCCANCDNFCAIAGTEIGDCYLYNKSRKIRDGRNCDHFLWKEEF